jgi:tRNA1Val (adenine37-N6)-methyltransferase
LKARIHDLCHLWEIPSFGGDLGEGKNFIGHTITVKRKIIPYHPSLKILAKKLRKNMTMTEAMLWKAINQNQLGVDFDRQRPIDNYIVDFYCKDLMLAIEIDGSSHYTEEAVKKDAIRQQRLETLGVRFLRFDNDDIKTNINGVIEIIREWINNNPELVGRIPTPNPSQEGSKKSSPSQEGSKKSSPSQEGSVTYPSKEGSRRKRERVFHFKQFSIKHEKSGMKVGTDGVLLGAWANVNGAKHILDIGTGSGVIALMLAQRTPDDSQIDAVEIDPLAFEEAHENFKTSPWSEKILAHHIAIQQFTKKSKYDLIISNPPYFQNSYKPPDEKRVAARHTENLSFEDLLAATGKLISPTGRLNVILPVSEGEHFVSLAASKNFSLTRKWAFRTRAEKPTERYLLEFSRHSVKSVDTGEIKLYDQGENWSEDYKYLTRDFYLKI